MNALFKALVDMFREKEEQVTANEAHRMAWQIIQNSETYRRWPTITAFRWEGTTIILTVDDQVTRQPKLPEEVSFKMSSVFPDAEVRSALHRINHHLQFWWD